MYTTVDQSDAVGIKRDLIMQRIIYLNYLLGRETTVDDSDALGINTKQRLAILVSSFLKGEGHNSGIGYLFGFCIV